MGKIKVGILGATGMVGQRFVTLLKDHPWFDVVILAASPASSGKKYVEAVRNRWKLEVPIPKYSENIVLKAVEDDFAKIAEKVDLIFSALDLEKEKIIEIENKYAKSGVAVVSNNSAHRWTEDVPMIIPEINPDHLELIKTQRKNRGWKGLIVVKPNCSLQSFLPIIHALKKFIPLKISLTTLQAISGSGKTFKEWPEMIDNVIPFIGGEEEKTEDEPMKILGKIKNRRIINSAVPVISATCIRVPVINGHMISLAVSFKNKPTREEVISSLENFHSPISRFNLPSAPKKLITYFYEDNRPQTNLDRNNQNGMGITCGRLRTDKLFDYKLIALSHNTIRGAAGGAILTAELLKAEGYL